MSTIHLQPRGVVTGLLLLIHLAAISQSVVNSLHNLSASGPGEVRAVSEAEICIFCHTPHHSQPSSPLWNRDEAGYTYTLYHSSTVQAAPGQPDGSSILCLSCHDGTTALGSVLSRSATIGFTGGITTIPAGSSNMSTDLADDHPISFEYNTGLASADGQLRDPSGLLPPVALERGKVQCTSCHDPHRDLTGGFLVVTRQYSELCTSCHDRNFWMASSHQLSTATWNGNGTDPWPRSDY